MTRYDLISPRQRKDGKTHWQKIGAAFPKDNGSFSLVFDALPLPDAEGRVTVLMKEPQPRDGQQGGYQQQGGGQQQQQQGGGPGGDLDGDQIPFRAEWRV